MSINSTVIVRGVSKPVMLPKRFAEQVRAAFENPDVMESFVIRVGNNSFRKSEIKHVEVLADGKSQEDLEAENRASFEDEKKNRSVYLRLPVETRARHLDMFKMFYKCARGEAATQEVLRQAYEIQLRFFTENPHRTICDPMLFKLLIGHKGHKQNIFETGYFKFIENAVARDLYFGGQKLSTAQVA